MSRRRRQCGGCPKYSLGYCSHLAKRVSQFAPACDYGRRQMTNAYMRKYMANKRKGENK